MAWVNEKDPTKAPPVYWLTGLAGLGKTTIAYTICELLNEARLPFASFFCSLQLDSRNSKLLVTTLCRDLAELYNSYAANVLPILETNSKVVDAAFPSKSMNSWRSRGRPPVLSESTSYRP
jgi:adenylylsulfate kinase-like enzyme